jgi:transposase
MLMLPAGQSRIHVCKVATDMRRSFEGLTYLVREVLKEDPLSGHLFLFLNRDRSKVKLLWWDRSGFAIWYKELQSGTFTNPEKTELTSAELMCLLEGIEIEGIRRKKRFSLRSRIAETAQV